MPLPSIIHGLTKREQYVCPACGEKSDLSYSGIEQKYNMCQNCYGNEKVLCTICKQNYIKRFIHPVGYGEYLCEECFQVGMKEVMKDFIKRK